MSNLFCILSILHWHCQWQFRRHFQGNRFLKSSRPFKWDTGRRDIAPILPILCVLLCPSRQEEGQTHGMNDTKCQEITFFSLICPYRQSLYSQATESELEDKVGSHPPILHPLLHCNDFGVGDLPTVLLSPFLGWKILLHLLLNGA